jgi:hypothetical protein
MTNDLCISLNVLSFTGLQEKLQGLAPIAADFIAGTDFAIAGTK